MNRPFDFPEDPADRELVLAAMKAEPVLYAYLLREQAEALHAHSRDLTLRADILGERTKSLRIAGEVRRLLNRS